MSIAFRSSSSADLAGVGATTTIALPAGVSATDAVVVTFTSLRSSTTSPNDITPPAGWTLIAATLDTNDGTNEISLHAFVALGNVANLAFTNSQTTGLSQGWVCAAYTGVDNTTPIDVAGTAVAGGASATAGSITIVTANAWELIAAAELHKHPLTSSGFAVANNGGTPSNALSALFYNTTPKSTGATATQNVGISISDPADKTLVLPFALRPSTPPSGSAALTGTVTLSATGSVNGSATLSGSASITAIPTVGGSAALSGAGTVTAIPSVYAQAALSGSASVTATPTVEGSVVPVSIETDLNAFVDTPAIAHVESSVTLTGIPTVERESSSVDYAVRGPLRQVVGQPATYTIRRVLGGSAAAASVTIASSLFGGVFSSSTVVLPAYGSSVTFTYTPPSPGTATFTFTNSGGLTDAAPLPVPVFPLHECIQCTVLPLSWTVGSAPPASATFIIPTSPNDRYYGGHISVTYHLDTPYPVGFNPVLGFYCKSADNTSNISSYGPGYTLAGGNLIGPGVTLPATLSGTTYTCQVPLSDQFFDCCEDASGGTLVCRFQDNHFFPFRTITVTDVTICLRTVPLPVTPGAVATLQAAPVYGRQPCAAAKPKTTVNGTFEPDSYLNGSPFIVVSGTKYFSDDLWSATNETSFDSYDVIRRIRFAIPQSPSAPVFPAYLDYAVLSLTGSYTPDHEAGTWETADDNPQVELILTGTHQSQVFTAGHPFIFDPDQDATTQPLQFFLGGDSSLGSFYTSHTNFGTINQAVGFSSDWVVHLSTRLVDLAEPHGASRTWGRFHFTGAKLELRSCVIDGPIAYFQRDIINPPFYYDFHLTSDQQKNLARVCGGPLVLADALGGGSTTLRNIVYSDGVTDHINYQAGDSILRASGTGSFSNPKLYFCPCCFSSPGNIFLFRDYTHRMQIYGQSAIGQMTVNLYNDTDGIESVVVVDSNTNCAYPSFSQQGVFIDGTYLRGTQPMLARSKTHGRTWTLTTIPGTYDSLTSVIHRGGRIVLLGFKTGAGKWYCRVGVPDDTGAFAWSSEVEVATTGPNGQGHVRAREDGVLEFAYSDGSNNWHILRGRGVSSSAGTGTWT